MKEPLLPEAPGRRAAAYWFTDGLPEIVAGAGLVALGGGAVWFDQIEPHSWPVRVTFMVLSLVSLMVVFCLNRSISLFLKSHVTFPRTGYVRPPSEWEEVAKNETLLTLGLDGGTRPPDQNVTRFRTSTICVMILAQIFAGAIPSPFGLPIAMSGAAILLYVLHRNSERPYHWASVLLLPAAGVGAMLLRMSQDENYWTAVFIGGAWLAVQGVWRLLGYVRRNPKGGAVEFQRR